MSNWECQSCGHRYNPQEGIPKLGVPAGTPFANLPAAFRCPECGARRDDFEEVLPDIDDVPEDENFDEDEAAAAADDLDRLEDSPDDLDGDLPDDWEEEPDEDDEPDETPDEDIEGLLNDDEAFDDGLDDEPDDALDEALGDFDDDELPDDDDPAYAEEEDPDAFADLDADADESFDPDVDEDPDEPETEGQALDDAGDDDFDDEPEDSDLDELSDDDDGLERIPYRCSVCGWRFDPAIGHPDAGVLPGTAFEDLLDDWCCPSCGASVDAFEAEPPALISLNLDASDTEGDVTPAADAVPESSVAGLESI